MLSISSNLSRTLSSLILLNSEPYDVEPANWFYKFVGIIIPMWEGKSHRFRMRWSQSRLKKWWKGKVFDSRWSSSQ